MPVKFAVGACNGQGKLWEDRRKDREWGGDGVDLGTGVCQILSPLSQANLPFFLLRHIPAHWPTSLRRLIGNQVACQGKEKIFTTYLLLAVRSSPLDAASSPQAWLHQCKWGGGQDWAVGLIVSEKTQNGDRTFYYTPVSNRC